MRNSIRKLTVIFIQYNKNEFDLIGKTMINEKNNKRIISLFAKLIPLVKQIKRECFISIKKIVIILMAGELKQGFLKFTLNDGSAYIDQEVRLKLYNPKLCSKSLSLYDLVQLQERYPIIRKFSIVQSCQSSEDQCAILCFESVQDAIDFQQEERSNLTFSMAMFQTEGDQNLFKKMSLSNPGQCLEKQLDQQGFCLENGNIVLKKRTSVQDLIKQESCPEEVDERSTIVQTERKLSICDEIQNEGYSHREQQWKQEAKQNNEGYFKSILDGLLVTGVMYGGFKLLKYLIKL